MDPKSPSLFTGFDLRDLDFLKALQVAMMAWITGNQDHHSRELQPFDNRNLIGSLIRLIELMDRSKLVGDMFDQFLEIDEDDEMLAAGAMLQENEPIILEVEAATSTPCQALFGPLGARQRSETPTEVWPSSTLTGNSMRAGLVSTHGRQAQSLGEIGNMGVDPPAERTVEETTISNYQTPTHFKLGSDVRLLAPSLSSKAIFGTSSDPERSLRILKVAEQAVAQNNDLKLQLSDPEWIPPTEVPPRLCPTPSIVLSTGTLPKEEKAQLPNSSKSRQRKYRKVLRIDKQLILDEDLETGSSITKHADGKKRALTSSQNDNRTARDGELALQLQVEEDHAAESGVDEEAGDAEDQECFDGSGEPSAENKASKLKIDVEAERAKNAKRLKFTAGIIGSKKPKKDRKLVALRDGVDFTNAQLGVEDWSYVYLHFKTVKLKENPEYPNDLTKLIPSDEPGRPVYNCFQWQIDWNDENDIHRLNNWRRQITARNFPPLRKGRPAWVEAEKQLILKLAEEQMKKSNGKLPKWKLLTNAFNKHMHGTIQPRGEKLIAKGTRNSDVLEEDRDAPWRTSTGISGFAKKLQEFKDLQEKYTPLLEIEDILAGIKEPPTMEESSEDEDEIPDPHPEPSTEIPPRKRYATKRKSGTMPDGKQVQAKRQKRNEEQEATAEDEAVASDVGSMSEFHASPGYGAPREESNNELSDAHSDDEAGNASSRYQSEDESEDEFGEDAYDKRENAGGEDLDTEL